MNWFSSEIIHWYNANKRDLPWRRTKDPYLIWLSEVILQQTRVDQGMDYYLSFTKEFPTIFKLAKAKEEKVLKLWQGLGYYSRARNLHTTARYICAKLKGKFPSHYEEIIKLKGVGQYTAAAIASFSFDHCYPVVDGNVFRVLSRIFAIQTPIDTNLGKKEFYTLARNLIDPLQPAIFNQAIMEFGALQCKPKNPNCYECVLNTHCIAFSKKIVDQLPVKSKSKQQQNRFFNYLLLKYKDKLLINKRNKNDIWQHLYDFPLIETDNQLSEQDFLSAEKWKKIIRLYSYKISSVSKIYTHVLSHQKIYARFWEIELTKPQLLNSLVLKEAKIIKMKELDKYPIPKLLENYLNKK